MMVTMLAIVLVDKVFLHITEHFVFMISAAVHVSTYYLVFIHWV